MTTERERTVEDLCLDALREPESERAAFLEAACAGDASLRREVESLLAGRSAADGFLERPAWESSASPLTPGTRLGAFEIVAKIGEGGMGVVYRARDTRLDRIVAIKVLPPAFAADPQRRARFEREAKAVAALSHPHICTLHDVGDHDGSMFLVMEHLSGKTLAARLEKGRLPLDEALSVATDIADALAAAHRHGVVHRDLKPGNVMLTKSGAKLLDFGLAKLAGHGEVAAVASLPSAPMPNSPLTNEGAIVGTLQYMAPEQVEGKPADARTDLWALGAILYEMLTGRRAFEGTSAASLIGSIMTAEPPPLATRQPLAPPDLDRLVHRCLAKAPDDRWDSAHDVAEQLRSMREASGIPTPAGVRSRRRRTVQVGLFVAGLLAAVVAGAALTWLLRPPASVPAAVTVRPAEELNAGEVQGTPSTPAGSLTALTWTPDGRSLVFVGRRGGVQQLYVRSLDDAEARPLEKTEGAKVPAVSPDGQWVAFWADGAIKKIHITGGPVTELVASTAAAAYGITIWQQAPWGLAWDADGGLYFTQRTVWHVAAGGKLEPVTTLRAGERIHALPSVLPGGRVLLFTIRRGWYCWGDDELVAQDLATSTRTPLLPNATDARYVPTGHLLFMKLGVLYAVAFDPQRLKVLGPETPVFEGIAQGLVSPAANDQTGAGQFALSSTGILAWISGGVTANPRQQVVTVDLGGHVVPLSLLPTQSYGHSLRLSPVGAGRRRLALSVRTLTADRLFVYDLERGDGAPLTQEGEAGWPLWTPDGRYVLFAWTRRGPGVLHMTAADGSGQPQLLWKGADGCCNPSSFSRDGVLAAIGSTPATQYDPCRAHRERPGSPGAAARLQAGGNGPGPLARWALAGVRVRHVGKDGTLGPAVSR